MRCNLPVLRSIVEPSLAKGAGAYQRSIHIRADFAFFRARFFVGEEERLARKELLLLVRKGSVDLFDFLAFVFSLDAVEVEFDDFAGFDVIRLILVLLLAVGDLKLSLEFEFC